MMNGDTDDAESVDLLASDSDASTIDPRLLYPPRRQNEAHEHSEASRPAKRSKVAFSPATQTLNSLSQSQQMADLHYDKLSQLEYDVVQALVQTKDARIDPIGSPVKPKDAKRTTDSSTNGSNGKRPSVKLQGFPSPEASSSSPDNFRSQRSTAASSQGGTAAVSRGFTTETKRIQQMDVATGEVMETFPTYVAASKKTGLGTKVISAIVKGKMESKNGWTFRLMNSVAPDIVNDESRDAVPPNKCAASVDQHEKAGKAPVTKQVPKNTESLVSKRMAIVTPKNTMTPSITVKTPITYGAIAVEELDAETGAVRKTYPSMTAAAKESNVTRHVISAVLRGKSESWNGRKWRYAADTNLDAPQNVDNPAEGDVKVKGHDTLSSNSSERTPNTAACDQEIKTNTEHSANVQPAAEKSATSKNCAMDSLPSRPEVITPCGYSFHRITITQEGSLGITVKKVETPKGAFHFPSWRPKEERDAEFSLQVESLLGDDGLARSLGIRAADYLLLSCGEGSRSNIGTQQDLYDNCYASVVKAIRSGNRPITLFAIRLQSNDVCDEDEGKANEIFVLSDDGSSAASGKSKPSKTPNELSMTVGTTHIKARDAEVSGNDRNLCDERGRGNTPCDLLCSAVPFCAVCNGQKGSRLVHHAWCPKNEHYLSSGADSIIERIVYGFKVLNCSGCQEEYQEGRRVASSHHSASCRSTKNLPSSQNSGTVNESQQTNCESIRDTQSLCQSPCRDDDNDSVYASPSKSHGRIQVLKVASVTDMPKSSRKTPLVQSATSVGKPANPKVFPIKSSKVKSRTTDKTAPKSKKSQRRGLVNSVKKFDSDIDEPPVSKSLHKSAERQGASMGNRSQSKPSGLVEMSVSDKEDTETYEKLNIDWEDCDNVWGPDGHMDEDVVVYTSNSNDECHYESLLLSPRYEIDPFQSYSRYQKTHSSPEEGYQALLLQRDLFASRPWGFSCERHEFGGACLVNAVDPLSPAEAATLLGAGLDTSSPLRINDMITVVNGKSVGGMTSAGVDIELEKAGPDLILIVSRYKFPEVVRKTISLCEQSHLHSFDHAINNDRELGWTDLGASAISPDSHVVVEPSCLLTDECSKARSLSSESSEPIGDSGSVNDGGLVEHASQDLSQNSSSTQRNSELRKVKTSSVESAGASKIGFIPIQNIEKEKFVVEIKEVAGKQKPRRSNRDMVRSISVENNCDVSSDSVDDGTDDGNAWCGCVCGSTHKKSQTHKEIFWIQCDACSSWYDCSSYCLGFTESQAKFMSSWTCWGCPVPESQCDLSTMEVNRPGRVSISPTAADPTDRNVRKEPDESVLSMNEVIEIVGDADDEGEVFSSGDLVYVTEHGWVGVNNPEGVAKVLKGYMDDDGDRVYDLKYVVGPKVNGVLPEYLRRHTFY